MYQTSFQIEKECERREEDEGAASRETVRMPQMDEEIEKKTESIYESVRKIKTVEGPFFSRMPSPTNSLVGAFEKREGDYEKEDPLHRRTKRSARVEEYRSLKGQSSRHPGPAGEGGRNLPVPPQPEEVDEEIAQAMQKAKCVIHKKPRCSFEGADHFQRKHGSTTGPERTLCDSFNNASPSHMPRKQRSTPTHQRRDPLLETPSLEEDSPRGSIQEEPFERRNASNTKMRLDQPHGVPHEGPASLREEVLGDVFGDFCLSRGTSSVEVEEAAVAEEERHSEDAVAETVPSECEPEATVTDQPEDEKIEDRETDSGDQVPDDVEEATDESGIDVIASPEEPLENESPSDEIRSEVDESSAPVPDPSESAVAGEVADEAASQFADEDSDAQPAGEYREKWKASEEAYWPSHCIRLGEIAGEQMHRLADRLSTKLSQGHKIMAIAGCSPGDGCTTLLLCAAREMARRGVRTVLVDGNFENPQLAELLQQSPECGWEEVLQGVASLDEAVLHCGRSSISLLPLLPSESRTAFTSSWNANPSACMRALSAHFDLVLIDAGKLDGKLEGEQVDDLLRFGVDGVVVVRNVRATSEPHLHHLRSQMQASGLVELGIAENFV
jgi:Mrp family chromosome partitioning ATPase